MSTTAPPFDRNQRGLALRPDGRQAAFLAPAGIAIWDLDPDRWVAAACEMAGRNLSPRRVEDVCRHTRRVPRHVPAVPSRFLTRFPATVSDAMVSFTCSTGG